MSERVGHIVTSPEVGKEATAWCGKTFTVESFVDKPICSKCVDVALDDFREVRKVADDLHYRLVDISKAISSRDEFGQDNWLHADAHDALVNAFWRPGPARPEGPAPEPTPTSEDA